MREDREQSRGGAGCVILSISCLVLIPLLYVLSCGPAVALMTRGILSQSAFDIIYFPLRFIATLSPNWIGRLLESYAELWAA